MIGTNLAMPVRTAFEERTGLRYELNNDIDVGRYYLYGPAAVFFVDGIRYDPARRGEWTRPMMEILLDDSGTQSFMQFSAPPADDEVDVWVRCGGEDDF